ncbi:hypothetical protein, partial [Pseudomonas canadensis]
MLHHTKNAETLCIEFPNGMLMSRFYESNCTEESQGCRIDLRGLKFSTAQNKTPSAFANGVSE